MEFHLKWWNALPAYRKKYMVEYYQWTTPDRLTDYQIQLIYQEANNY